MNELADLLDEELDEPIVEDEKPTKKAAPKRAASKKAPVNPVGDWMAKWSKVIADSKRLDNFTQIVPTGVLAMDIALGHGGLPLRGLVTIYGPEGSGKSTLVQTIVGNVQTKYPDKIIVWVDGEDKLDAPTAERNGMKFTVDLLESGRLLVVQPSIENGYSWEKMMLSMEQLMLVAPNGIVLVVDSTDSMMVQSEIAQEADDGGAKYGAMAKANSVTLKRFVGLMRDTNSSMIAIQQLREQSIGKITYGPPKQGPAGGHAILHYPKVQIELKKAKKITKTVGGDTETNGREVIGIIHKNNFHRPEVTFGFDLRYDYSDTYAGGIDRAGGLIDVAAQFGFMDIDGAAHVIPWLDAGSGEPVKLNGRDKMRAWLLADPERMATIEKKIRTQLYGG